MRIGRGAGYMGSGFLRDIALRKQLEEKVREAAKTRQMAEEEANAAKALIEGVKKIGGDISDAEGALADATAAMGSKDYKVALERASEAKERAKRAYGDRARHFLDTTRNLMTVTQGLGVDVRDGLQALDKADEAYAREAYEDAVELAQKAWKKIEKGLHEHLSSSFSTAQSLIMTAKGIGKNTSSAEDLLSRARSAVESNDYEQAISFTQECLDTVTAELREEVDRATQGARAAVQSAQELGMDPGAAVRHLDRAQGDMEHGQYDKALNALKQARTEAEKALGKSLESRASDFLRMIEEAEKIGAEVGPARNLLRAFENAMRDGNLAEATNLAKEGYKVLQKAQFDRVVLTISASRDKFLTARNIGADLTPAIEGLNRARLALQAGKFQEALAASRHADETLDQIVRELRSIEAEIRVLSEAIGEAERLGVDVSNPKRSLDHVRSALAQKDFRTATENLRRGREELEQARTDRAMQAIEKAEHLLAMGEKMGARLDEASAVLEEAVGAGRARNFEKAAELAVQSRELTEKAVHTALGEMVAGLKGGMQYLGEDAPSVRTLLERVESTLSARDFDAAYGYVEEARRLAEGRTKDRAVQFHELLRSAVQLGIQVGVDVHSLEALLHEANAEADRGRYAEVVALKEKAMRDLAVAAENAFNQVKAKVVEAKNLHIDIAEMRDMLKRAKVALGVEDYAQAFQLLSGCNEKASKILSMHKEVYNAISSAAALVAEAKKRDVNVSKVLDMLLEAKRAHERFDYEKALELAQRAKAETEKLMVLYTSAQKIMAARELLAVMARAGIEAPHLKQLLDDAKEAIKDKEYQAALEHSERGEREVHELMHERTAS
ncbi:MAG: hypothetical protein HY557_05295, partial [Euryarchaeota archaeon]|nr:hypothetical protein [Euryarchaeota archaeon]